MIWSGLVSNQYEILSMSILSASFRNIRSKLKESWWWQAFSHCKSMGSCGCHQPRFSLDFHEKIMPSIPYQRHAIDEKWLRSACRLWRYNWSNVWTDVDGLISSAPRWAKMTIFLLSNRKLPPGPSYFCTPLWTKQSHLGLKINVCFTS